MRVLADEWRGTQKLSKHTCGHGAFTLHMERGALRGWRRWVRLEDGKPREKKMRNWKLLFNLRSGFLLQQVARVPKLIQTVESWEVGCGGKSEVVGWEAEGGRWEARGAGGKWEVGHGKRMEVGGGSWEVGGGRRDAGSGRR